MSDNKIKITNMQELEALIQALVGENATVKCVKGECAEHAVDGLTLSDERRQQVEAAQNAARDKMVAFNELAAHACFANGVEWSPVKALQNGDSIYCLVVDTEEYEDLGPEVENNIEVYEVDPGDYVHPFCIYYKSEEMALKAYDECKDTYLALFKEFVTENVIGEEPKTLTKQDVEAAVLELLEEPGSTTTNLDIKTYLREQGFWATQSEVSGFMQEVMHDLRLNVASKTTNGNNYLVFAHRA